ADGPQFAAALRASVNHPQPIYFRISRGHDPVVYAGDEPFEFGKAVVHGIGSDLTFIACGMAVHSAKQAMESLNGKGHSVGLIDMHTIKPLDRVVLMQAARKSRIILTVEEHNILGGLGG
ncbi:MAG: transketolase, partial [Mesorhizobium sp.]